MRKPIRNNNNMLYERIMKGVDKSVRNALNESISGSLYENESENVTGIGQTFTVKSPDLYNFKVRNYDIKNVINSIVLSEDESGFKLNDDIKKLAERDITLNAIIEGRGIPYQVVGGNPRSPFFIELEDQNKLTISIFDLGWDYYIDNFEETLRMIDDGLNDDYYSPEELLNNLVTFSYFDYYNEFANNVVSELNKIYGYAQECYEGFDGERFISGYDVDGGSILLIMPIGANWEYEIVDGTDGHSFISPADTRENATAVYRPTSFYGPDDTHFYNTKQRKDIYGHSELGIDLRLD